MASVSAALHAAFGLNLPAALSASAVAGLNANLTAAIAGFNVNGATLTPQVDRLAHLQLDLMGLVSLSGVVTAVKVAYGIDLRAPGALAALQARLAVSPSAALSVAGSTSVSLQVSAATSLMAALGAKVDAQGAAAVGVQAQALAQLMEGLPPMEFGLPALAMLANVLAMVTAIRLALGVDLLAPSAALDLRVALASLPVEGLAQLGAAATLTWALPTASAFLSAAAAADANAVAALDLSATADAQLTGLMQISMLVQVMVQGKLGLPAGGCGGPCPLALPAASAAGMPVHGDSFRARRGSETLVLHASATD